MQAPLLHVVPVEHILGKLSLVQAGDTGTIPMRTWRGIRQIMMSFGTSITQAVGLTLRLDVATEPGCGIRMRGPWDGLATCDMFEPVDV